MQPSVVRTLVAVLVLAATDAAAQRPPLSARLGDATPAARPGRQSADSARVWRSVRSAQAAFERRRFDNLPWTWHPGREECEEYIGRFCFWHDDPSSSWRPPPEARVVADARERLIGELETAATRLPGGAWVAGQRVRYLVQAGRAEEAATVAAECRAGGGWCQALRGYALHHAGRHAEAETAFEGALAALPAAERGEWTDLRPILRDAELRPLLRLDAPARAAMERRMWWLADPLWMEPGNDRRTEHFARLVADRLQDRARTPEGISWGDDMREILLRYGEPIGWQRVRNRPGATERASVITHHAPRSWDFLPLWNQVEDPTGIAAEDWKLKGPRPRTTYAPAYLSELVDDFDHQLAVFCRDGRAEVVAAWTLEHDSLPERADVEAALILANSDTAAALEARGRFAGGWGALRLAAPMEPAVVSVEAVERGKKIGGRARFGVEPRRREVSGGLALSDVLLLKEGAGRADDLEGAMFLARGSTKAKAGERVGLYWEVYGLPRGADTLTFSVGLARLGSGGLRRVAERLGLLSAIAPGRMRWREETGGGAILPRSTVVALPRVPPGEYLLEVTVRAAGGPAATATRRITIER